LSTSIKSLTQDDGAVWVELSDGSAATYDLVIGADGVGSSVRSLAFDAPPPVYGEQMVWGSLAPVRPRGLTNLQFLLGDGCFFGLCPVGSDQTYGFGTSPARQFAIRRRAASHACANALPTSATS
jgi:2-polyprenyl-6-methoxyphenol hydroxylase-like FAD-dependent oxidoreductase